ncbi:MAG: hypothetical protein KGQ75_01275 [Sphingomonadales bacterium]|nr:hypothetical protein [Sphingomonadales bacterium]
MRRSLLAVTMLATLAAATLPETADARRHTNRTYRVCRHSSGTAGLIAGGAGGALVGKAVLGGPVGIVAGAVGGAFAGRAIDRTLTAKKRCRRV